MMEDKDIIKALEIHADIEADCSGCPIYHSDTGETCVYELSQNALDLINRQKAEIERLQRLGASTTRKLLNARAEVITEYQERLKVKAEPMPCYSHLKIVYTSDIDQIAKEMKEGVNNEG